jgi:hypothetical protein
MQVRLKGVVWLAALAWAATAGAGCRHGPKPGAAGSACSEGEECRAGLSCLVDLPGGYCTTECPDGTCPVGTSCRDLSGLLVCLQECDEQRDCRDDYRCIDAVCDVPCASEADCPSGQRCDTADGSCVPFVLDCTQSPAPAGCACAGDGDCASGDCLPPGLGGVCTAPCDDEQDCSIGLACGVIVVSDGAGGLQLVTTCLPENAGGVGLDAACATDADCRDTICFGGRCSEVCTECAAGFDCRAVNYNSAGATGPLDLCVNSSISKDVIELGGLSTTAAAGTGDQTFVLPAGSVALTVVAEINATNVCVLLRKLVDPAGTVWYDLFGTGAPLLRPQPGVEVMTVLVPDNDTSPAILDGEWTVALSTYDCVSLFSGTPNPVASFIDRVAILPKPFYDGVLDLNLHFTPASGISAASASSSLWVTNFVNEFWSHYGSTGVGMTPGVVSFFDAPSTYNTLSSQAALWGACADLSEPGPGGGAAVNIVVVGDYGGALAGAAGISGGAPGSMMNDHVPLSCVTVQALTFSGVLMGVDMAHETGHFLSMKHTSEFGGASCGAGDPDYCYDAIADTGECADPTPTSAACPDFTNLMYPALNGAMGSFSPGQELVLSGVPLLR